MMVHQKTQYGNKRYWLCVVDIDCPIIFGVWESQRDMLKEAIPKSHMWKSVNFVGPQNHIHTKNLFDQLVGGNGKHLEASAHSLFAAHMRSGERCLDLDWHPQSFLCIPALA